MDAPRVAPIGVEDGNINDSSLVPIEELPENHLCRLVYRDSRRAAAERPLDWDAVTQRLLTPEGALEARQWVGSGLFESCGRQLFLHFVCRAPVCASLHDAEGEAKERILRAVIQTVKTYPDALRFPDNCGEYPLHILCQNLGFHLSWKVTAAARELFKTVLFGNPDAAKVRIESSERTVLHCFTQFHLGTDGDSDGFEMLLEVFPDAVKLRDRHEDLPLHIACRAGNVDVVKTLLDAYPRAIQLLSNSKSCLQQSLMLCYRPSDYDVARLLLEACPWLLANDDENESSFEEWGNDALPVGDSLDYIYHNYCKSLGVWAHTNTTERGVQGVQYFRWNVAFLEAGPQGGVDSEAFTEATFDMVVHILFTLYGRTNRNSPLHAAVHGSLCRPWNLVVLKEVVSRFDHEAQEADHNGNLPLHLFLKSCMIECDRAIERRFVKNGEEYEEAVARCLRILLDAHMDAAATANGDGRLPLHLALDHHSLSFETAVEPLLDQAPWSVLARDIKTGLYPFMSAAVGANANVDMTYRLLRRDPTALLQVGISADNSHESRKRKRA